MKTKFKSEQKISKMTYDVVDKETIEKRIIIEFISNLPMCYLKQLINFKEIDFENKKMWEDYKKQELLNQLRDENVVKYTCELYIDTQS